MVIDTDTPELHEERRSLLEMLAWRYPADAVQQLPDKPFHRLLREFGLDQDDPRQGAERGPRGSIASVHRRRHVALHRLLPVRPHLRRACRASSSGTCGIAASRRASSRRPDACARARASVAAPASTPVRRARWRTPPSGLQAGRRSGRERRVPTAASGCEMNVGTRDGRIVPCDPSLDAPVSKGHLCVKGRYAFDFVHAADRMTEPMIRDDAAGGASRGRGPRLSSRPAARADRSRTARTASASSDRRVRPTKTTTSRRSSRAS